MSLSSVWKLCLIVLLSAALAACSAGSPEASAVATTPAEAVSATEEAPPPASALTEPPNELPVETPLTASDLTAEPTLTEPPAAVDYLANPPALLELFPQPPVAAGEALILYGQALDANGKVLPGLAVEIWQTDANGVYDHPGDPGTAGRDLNFQFYGTSLTDAFGQFVFRTLLPGEYGSRPRHIHVRVKRDGAVLLTTQFYFTEDLSKVSGEAIFAQAGDQGELLLVPLTPVTDAAGSPLWLGRRDLVLDSGLGAGVLALTPAQAEGPYYPVVDVVAFDNDLLVVGP
jgi:protocatechuate 3,4-dioxygenase, beta subunit